MEDTQKVQEELTEPLFTGDYTRDTAVSEYEKVAEVSTFLWGIIKCIFKKKSKRSRLKK